jgi:hypothetical protein
MHIACAEKDNRMINTESHATVVTDQNEQPASQRTPSKKRAGHSRSKKLPKTKATTRAKATAANGKTTNVSKQSAKAVPTQGPRAGSKGASILALIARGDGATLAEIIEATGWQPHSVRGFLATAPKKHHFKLESAKNDKGERVYRVSK